MSWKKFCYFCSQGVQGLRSHRLSTISSVTMLVICLALVGTAYLVSANVNTLMDHLESQNETVVYIREDLSNEDMAELDAALRSISGVASMEYVSSEEAMERYLALMSEEDASLWDVFEGDSPLIPSYSVSVHDLNELDRIVEEIALIPGVDSISAARQVSGAFLQMQKAVNYVGIAIVAVLVAAGAGIICNASTIAVFARREEIGVMKFVGATNGFIMAPFLLEGILTGLIAAGIASAIVLLAYSLLLYWSGSVLGLWNPLLGIQLVPVGQVWYRLVPAFMLYAILAAGIGCWLSVRRYLER